MAGQIQYPDNSQLGGEFWNSVVKELVDFFTNEVNFLVKELKSDGYPPFHVPTTPQQQYDTLLAMRMAFHPAYWSSQAAQLTLDKLAADLNRPLPPIPAPPFQPGPTNLVM